MCYAVPGKVMSIDKDNALVDYGGVKKTVNISLIESTLVGEYVLVHAGFAIQKVDKSIARESLRAWKDLNI
jgi:hydrogenase expression/formation protein HypC